MAFVWKTPDCKNWIARFTDNAGKRRNRSTGTPVRKMAEKIAAEFEKAAKLKRTARQTRSVISELHKEITGDEIRVTTMREFVAEWLESKQGVVAESTLTFYKGCTKKFLDWLGAKADLDIADVSPQQIVEFRAHEEALFEPKTVNHELKCLRMVFKAAKRDAFISEKPTEFVESVRDRRQKNKRAFTVEELRRVLASSSGEWKSMVFFGLYTGQRLGDVATLRWTSINLVRNEISLNTGKTGRYVVIPIPPALRRHIDTLQPPKSHDAPVHSIAFETVERQKKTGGLSNQFADILAAAGLRAKKAHRKSASGKVQREPLSFHSLRATATTMLHEAGIPASVAQALIGHDSSEIHQDYVRVGMDALRRAADALPDLDAASAS